MITTKGDNYECTEKSLFIKLFVERIAILIAIVLGGVVGILISEFERSAKLTLGVINFLYTIPSISMLGFLIPFSGVGNATAVIALLALVMDLILGHKIDLVIDTPTQGRDKTRDGFLIRRTAIETGIYCITAMDTANALVTSMEHMNDCKELTLVDIAQL